MQHVAAADRVARDHRDDGLRRAADLDLQVEHVEPADALLRDLVVADVAVVAPDALIAAGAERLVALAGEDDDADLGVVARLVERVRQLEQGLRPERVAHLGPADRDLRDALGGVVADVVVVARSHARRSAGRALRRSACRRMSSDPQHREPQHGSPVGSGACRSSSRSPVPSARFDADLRRAWDDGDAVFPLDLRLAAPARRGGPARRWRRPGSGTTGASATGSRAVVRSTTATRSSWPRAARPASRRGVVLTHDAVAASAVATSERLGVDRRTRSVARLSPALPRRRALGRDPGLGAPARRCEVHAGFDVTAVEDAARRGATLVSLVPTALRRIDAIAVPSDRARRRGTAGGRCRRTSSRRTA